MSQIFFTGLTLFYIDGKLKSKYYGYWELNKKKVQKYFPKSMLSRQLEIVFFDKVDSKLYTNGALYFAKLQMCQKSAECNIGNKLKIFES